MTYKDFEKQYIGSSDYAVLTLTGIDTFSVAAGTLAFGGDGSYSAYIVKGIADIGEHYDLQYEYEHWLKIYDDTELVKTFCADVIRVFRSGAYGCIIQLLTINY